MVTQEMVNKFFKANLKPKKYIKKKISKSSSKKKRSQEKKKKTSGRKRSRGRR